MSLESTTPSALDSTTKTSSEKTALNPQLNLVNLAATTASPEALAAAPSNTGDQYLPNLSIQQLTSDITPLQKDLSNLSTSLAADGGIWANLGQSVSNLNTDLTKFINNLSSGSSAPDAIIKGFTDTDPTLAVALTNAQDAVSSGQMTQAGFSQFENAVNQNFQSNLKSGQFADDTSLLNNAAGQLSTTSSAADVTAATNATKAAITTDGDNYVSNYAPQNDATIQAMTNPQSPQGEDQMVATVFNNAYNHVSAQSYSQFEQIASADTKSLGTYPDDPTLLTSAVQQFKQAGNNAADAQALQNVIGDATGADANPNSGGTTPTGANGVSLSEGGASVPGGWSANFDNAGTSQATLNQLFPVQWGGDTINSNGSVSISAQPGEPNVAQAGFMQSDNGAQAGSGYGVYTMTASFASQGGDGGTQDGPGSGDYVALWPATNQWPGDTSGHSTTTGQEIDLWENYAGNQIGTLHWGTNGQNESQTNAISGVDPTKENTYTAVWEPVNGVPTLTEYVNAGGVGAAPLQEVYSANNNVGPDAANGGSNESFGIGAESSEPDGGAGSVATVYAASYTPYVAS